MHLGSYFILFRLSYKLMFQTKIWIINTFNSHKKVQYLIPTKQEVFKLKYKINLPSTQKGPIFSKILFENKVQTVIDEPWHFSRCVEAHIFRDKLTKLQIPRLLMLVSIARIKFFWQNYKKAIYFIYFFFLLLYI